MRGLCRRMPHKSRRGGRYGGGGGRGGEGSGKRYPVRYACARGSMKRCGGIKVGTITWW